MSSSTSSGASQGFDGSSVFSSYMAFTSASSKSLDLSEALTRLYERIGVPVCVVPQDVAALAKQRIFTKGQLNAVDAKVWKKVRTLQR